MRPKTFYVLLIFFVLFAFSTACNQQRNSRVSTSTEVFDAEYLGVFELFDKLMSSFSPNWRVRESDPDLYPDYFAGMYIGDDSRLVILVTENADRHRQKFAEILGTDADDFEVRTVQFSYRQMFEVIEQIEDFLMNPANPDNHIFIENFTGAFVDDESNRVVVMLTSTGDAVIDAFRNEISDSEVVVFEEGGLFE